jgi:hypothetical protein
MFLFINGIQVIHKYYVKVVFAMINKNKNYFLKSHFHLCYVFFFLYKLKTFRKSGSFFTFFLFLEKLKRQLTEVKDNHQLFIIYATILSMNHYTTDSFSSTNQLLEDIPGKFNLIKSIYSLF